jgi:transcriptional regulator with XRE-family HTH domain
MLGARIRRLIKAKGFTQSAFATKTGIERTELSRILSGKKAPHPDQILWIAEALEIAAEVLLEGAEMPSGYRKAMQKGEEAVHRVIQAEGERDEARARIVELTSEVEALHAQLANERTEADQRLAEARAEDARALAAQKAAHAAEVAGLRMSIGKLADENRKLTSSVHVANASNIALQKQVQEARNNATGAAVFTGLMGILVGGALGSSGGDEA